MLFQLLAAVDAARRACGSTDASLRTPIDLSYVHLILSRKRAKRRESMSSRRRRQHSRWSIPRAAEARDGVAGKLASLPREQCGIQESGAHDIVNGGTRGDGEEDLLAMAIEMSKSVHTCRAGGEGSSAPPTMTKEEPVDSISPAPEACRPDAKPSKRGCSVQGSGSEVPLLTAPPLGVSDSRFFEVLNVMAIDPEHSFDDMLGL